MAQIPPDQKFHTLNANTPTQERGSAQADGLREIYTMQDIIDSVGGPSPFEYTNNGSSLDFSANITMKAVAEQNLASGVLLYFVDFDPATGYPRVTDASSLIADLEYEAPFGMVNSPIGSSSAVAAGETFDMLICGIAETSYIENDAETGAPPTAGAPLSASRRDGAYSTLGSERGTGLGCATMLVPSTGGIWDNLIFFSSSLISTADRGTKDRIGRDNTTRQCVYNNSAAIAYGTLIEYGGNIRGLTPRCQYYTGSGAENIWGIAATGTGTNTNADFSICTDGLVGRVTVYDASHVALSTSDASIYTGSVVYAGDGVTNAHYELTTDSTSGVPVGIIFGSDDHYVLSSEPNTWKILFQPARLSGGGGATEGEKLDFTVRSNAYAATGDHEGTDLKIGGAASVTAGTVYYWNGDWAAADNTAVGTSTGMIAVATDTGTGVNMLKDGIIQLSANPAGASAGDVLYVGTSGALTITAPTGSGEIVRVAGHTIDTAGLVYFNPSQDWLEIV